MMNFHVLTLFPEMVLNGLNTSITGKAVKNGLINIEATDIRNYSKDKHNHVDDYPYGGGAGMVMQPMPVYDAYIDAVKNMNGTKRVIYLTPQGKVFNQRMAEEFAKEENLIFLCGHYEGIDERVLNKIVTDDVSIGDYVLTGGELAAMVMIDAVSRFVPDVLGTKESATEESIYSGLLEYDQYTKPREYEGLEVPEVLFNGNHKLIHLWQLRNSLELTKERRPDLWKAYLSKEKKLSKDEKKILDELVGKP